MSEPVKFVVYFSKPFGVRSYEKRNWTYYIAFDIRSSKLACGLSSWKVEDIATQIQKNGNYRFDNNLRGFVHIEICDSTPFEFLRDRDNDSNADYMFAIASYPFWPIVDYGGGYIGRCGSCYVNCSFVSEGVIHKIKGYDAILKWSIEKFTVCDGKHQIVDTTGIFEECDTFWEGDWLCVEIDHKWVCYSRSILDEMKVKI